MMKDKITADLKHIGITDGDVLMVHSSFKSLGVNNISPNDIVDILINSVGKSGTLLMPALSGAKTPKGHHDNKMTPSNIGVIPEAFRLTSGVRRSLHPTHSVCAIGRLAEELLGEHEKDRTPCGVYSPFRKILFINAKILMLGCTLKPNTIMHAVEECIGTPYLLGEEMEYSITDPHGNKSIKIYRNHDFTGVSQRYDRLGGLINSVSLRKGMILKAESYLIETEALFEYGINALKNDRYYFVDKIN